MLRRPTSAWLARFVERAQRLDLSYAPVGLARETAPAGYRVREARIVLGHGPAVFARAAQLVAEWRQFELGWVSVYPPAAPVVPGTTVAVVARHLGFWSAHACRIVYPVSPEVGSPEAPRAAGFAYGTLADHAEMGEEIFAVTLDSATGAVTYSIRAASRERALLARVGAPIARALQARFRRDSLAAMERHIRAG